MIPNGVVMNFSRRLKRAQVTARRVVDRNPYPQSVLDSKQNQRPELDGREQGFIAQFKFWH